MHAKKKKESLLQALANAQDQNQARISKWKTLIHADAEQQRLLIIKNLSERFMVSAIREMREKREAGGSSVRKKVSMPPGGVHRPATAPVVPSFSRASSWLNLIPQRPNTANDDFRHLHGLHEHANMGVADKRKRFLQTISNAQNKDELVIRPLVTSHINLEMRDSRAVFNALVGAEGGLKHAQRVHLVHDVLGSVRKKCSAFPEGVWVAPSKLKKTGMAILVDPSLNTKGKRLTICLRYEEPAAASLSLTHSATRASSRGPSPNQDIMTPLPTSRGSPRAATTGGGRASTPGGPTPRGRAQTPGLHGLTSTNSTPLQTSRGGYTPNASQFGGSRGGGSRSASPTGRSMSRGRRQRKAVTRRELGLRGAGSFDLPLAAETSKYDGGAWDESYEYYDICLPGWGDVAPLFVPANVCVMSIDIAPLSPSHSRGSRSFSIPRNSGTTFPTTLTSTNTSSASTRLNLADEAPSVTIVGIVTFPCRSPAHAAHLMSKFFSGTFRPRAANVPLPGGLALQIASFHGNVEAVKQLLDNGANVNLRTLRFPRNTALHDAVLGGKEEVLKLLLKRGAKQIIADDAGNTPLHLAAMQANVPVARILMAAEGAALALSKRNGKKLLPLDLSGSAFMRATLELGMRAHGIMMSRKALA